MFPARQHSTDSNLADVPPSVVLLVEDDKLSQRLVAKIFEGHEVLLAETATEAMQVLRANPHVDLAVVDYQLRGEHGSSFVAEVRRHAFCHDLPIIAYTGSRDRDVVLRYAELRAQAFHLKPYRAEVLLRELVKAHGGGRRERLFESTEQACARMKLGPEEYAGLLNKGAALLETDLQRVRQLLLSVNDPRLHSTFQHISDRLPQMGVRIAEVLARSAENELLQGDFHACTQTLSVLDNVVVLARRRALELLSLGDSVVTDAKLSPHTTARPQRIAAVTGLPFHLRPVLSQPIGLLGPYCGGASKGALFANNRLTPAAAQAFINPCAAPWFEVVGLLDRIEETNAGAIATRLAAIPAFEATMHHILVRTEVVRPHALADLKWNDVVAKLGVAKSSVFAAAGVVGRAPNKSPLALQRLRAHSVAMLMLGYELGRFLRLTHPQRIAAAAVARNIGLWTLCSVEPLTASLLFARAAHHGDMAQAEREIIGGEIGTASEHWIEAAGLPVLYREAAADRIDHDDSRITLHVSRLVKFLVDAVLSAEAPAIAACRAALADPENETLVSLKNLGVTPPVDAGESVELIMALAQSACWIAEEITNPR
jgi:CheY-like chemotaxis protein